MRERFTKYILIAILVGMIGSGVHAVNKMLKTREFIVLEVDDLVAALRKAIELTLNDLREQGIWTD